MSFAAHPSATAAAVPAAAAMAAAPAPAVSPPTPVRDFLRRYRDVFQAAWQQRQQLDGPQRKKDELAFLPAAMSLQETPVHPAPRRTAIAICALFTIALVWACLGQLDIVAVAHGRIVVSERTKTLQPLEASVVRRVLVRDGDKVQAGQVLVELDGTNAAADEATVKDQLRTATSELQRTQALSKALNSSNPSSNNPSGNTPSISAAGITDTATKDQLKAEWSDITAKLAKLDAEQARRQAEAATAQQIIAKLDATIPLVKEREADLVALQAEGFMNKHATQDRTRERVELERDLATQRARLAEAQASLTESRQAKQAYLAETKRALSERQAKATQDQAQLTQTQSKTQARTQLTQLTAPVSGTVQQVAVHTAGGVVTPAQVLMVIVPQDAVVSAEVVLDNKDVGFVSVGQEAAVKLETFSFTRYGTIAATVANVSADAVVDDKRGAVFPAVLKLAKTSLEVDGKVVNLVPGMNLTAEVKTGRRRVIEYLLSPVQRTAAESVQER
jgi:hemolysin D